MSRALVVVTHGDQSMAQPMAGALVENMTRKVIPLDGEELEAVKAELAAVKAEKARQDAREGVREYAESVAWREVQEGMAVKYAVRQPGPVRGALLLGWAMLWEAVYGVAEALMRWNREGY